MLKDNTFKLMKHENESRNFISENRAAFNSFQCKDNLHVQSKTIDWPSTTMSNNSKINTQEDTYK